MSLKPLIQLRLFGGVALLRNGAPEGGSRATQRRRIAVLALLAGAPGQQLSRDKVLAYLWPESGTDAARHLLAGAVYELRKALGEKAVLSRGDDLALNPEVIESELAAFDAAVERNDRAAAIALYRGPFADGFFVSEAPEFERWVEETRSQYQRTYRDLLEIEARARQQAGKPAEAADLWLRVAKLDPADGRVTLHAMEGLHQAGQSAAALRVGQSHVDLLRREFDDDADAEVMALIDSIRKDPKRPTPLPAPELPSASPLPIIPPPARMPVRGMIAGFAGGALVLVLLVLAGLSGHGAEEPTILPPGSVLVLPFAAPDAQHEELRYHLAALMGTGLDGAGDLDIKAWPAGVRFNPGTPPSHDSARTLAARAGAAGFVLGQVEELSDQLRLRASLYVSGNDDPLVEATSTGSARTVADVVDRLVLNLLAAWPRPPGDRLSTVAARSARSLPALKAWLTGEREYQAGRFLAASEAFNQAIIADSSFAIGYHRLSHARLAADFPETRVISLDDRATALSGSLAERDQLLIRAYTHFRKGEAESAEQRYQSLVNLYPDDVEAWTGLGETRFHYNPLRGLPMSDARSAFERAAEINPNYWTVQWHLAHLDAMEGKLDEFVRIMDRLLARNPENATRQDLSYLRAVAAKDRAAELAMATEIANADELRLIQLIWRAAVYLKDLEAAERIATVLANPARPAYPRMLGRLSLVYLDLALGRWEAAEEHLRIAGTIPGVAQVLDTRVAMALLPQSPATDGELRLLRDSVIAISSRSDSLSPQQLRLAGILSSAIGDTTAALDFAQQLDKLGATTASVTIRADLAFRAGRLSQALGLLQQHTAPSWYGYHIGAPLSLNAYARFSRGEVLTRLGRKEEGEGWYRSLLEFSLADLAYRPAVNSRAAGR